MQNLLIELLIIQKVKTNKKALVLHLFKTKVGRIKFLIIGLVYIGIEQEFEK
jgi:hypothetical protein